MTSDDDDPVAELFHELAELAPDERWRAYHARQVPDEVRTEVEALLAEAPLPAFADEAISSASRRMIDGLDAMSWHAGSRIGDYEIVREVARGGMGVVYEAKQHPLGRRVALKVVRGARFADATEKRRFRVETEAIARLDHPGVVPVYDVGSFDGQPFYTMAFLGGGSLKDLPTPVTPRRAAELVALVCDAIHYAHTQNIVHRDLKPANVLLSEEQEPRVSDFGLAKDTSEDSDLTYTGAILGTPGFMAPEQASGRNDAVGHLADVYGLGGVLFYLLTGRAPIVGETVTETLQKVLHEEAPDPRSLVAMVPADLASICRKALEKQPIDRYGSAAALAADLRRFLTGEATEARPLRPGQRALRWCRRRPGFAALAVLAVAAVLGGGVTSYAFAVVANDKAHELAESNRELSHTIELLAAARDTARSAQQEAESFSRFLIDDVIASARPPGASGGLGVEITVRDALLKALPKVSERFAGNPVAEALARSELGTTLHWVGSYDEAIAQHEQALELRRRELGPDADLTIETGNVLGVSYFSQARFEQAIAVFEDLALRTETHNSALHSQVLENLARSYSMVGRHEDQLRQLRRAQQATTNPFVEVRLMCWVAIALIQNGQQDEGRAELKQMVARWLELDLDRVPPYDRLHLSLDYLTALRKLEDEDMLLETVPTVLKFARQVVSPVGREVEALLEVLLGIYDRRHMTAEAAAALREQFEVDQQHDGPNCCDHGERLARLELSLGRRQPAIDAARLVRERLLATDPTGDAAFRLDVLATELLLADGRPAEARTMLEPRLPLLRELVAGGRGGPLPALRTRAEELVAALRQR